MVYDLNVRHPGLFVTDIEGIDLPDLEAARQEAIGAARELMADAVIRGEDISDGVVEIVQESDRVISQVPFTDAIRRRG